MMAARSPALGCPLKRQFFFPRALGRITPSTRLDYFESQLPIIHPNGLQHPERLRKEAARLTFTSFLSASRKDRSV
jgi:hypothetical protein